MVLGSIIIGYIFCIVSFIYISMGIYALSLNFDNSINKIFFFVCLSANIWTLSYSMATIADTAEMALFFNRVSSLGWGTFYAFLLHFTKILVNRDKKISKKYYLFMYLPSVLIILFMGVLESSKLEYNMVKNLWGYTSITPATFTNTAFSIYTIVFAVMQIINVLKWNKELHYTELKKYIRICIILSFASTTLTFITDMIIIRIMHIHFAQLAIVWTLMPVSFIFLTLIKSRRMHSAITPDINFILGNRLQEKIFQITGVIYILVSYALYISDYLSSANHSDEKVGYIFSSMLLGIVYLFLLKMFKNTKKRNMLLIIIYMVSIVWLFFGHYHEIFIIIWGLFFSYIALASIFDRKIYSFVILVFIIVFSLIYSYFNPSIEYTFTIFDQLKRIVIMLLFYVLITYINNSYRKNDENNIRQIKNQKIINNIYSKIIDLDIYNTDEKIIEMLNIINKEFNSLNTFYIKLGNEDKITVYSIEKDNLYTSYDYERTIFKLNPKWLELMYKNEELMIFDIQREDFASMELIKKFQDRGITGCFASPIFEGNMLKAITVTEFILNDENKLLYIYKDTFTNLILDAIKKIATQKVLYKKLNYDDITELKNRLHFVKEATEILDTNRNIEYFMIYLDVDNFKVINDVFGHLTGDEVLKQISVLLQKNGHKNNLYNRISGDEFVIFCDKSYTKESVKQYVKDILDTFKSGVTVNDNKFRLNVSIGISKYPEDGDTIELLIKNSHIAMNKAKDMVNKKYHFCDSGDKLETMEYTKYTDKLYTALDNNEFELYYQPQISLEDNRIIGAEALLRWNSAEYGYIPPYKFIPILERTGMIVEVGEWVIEEVMKQIVRLEEMELEPIRISINLSVIQCLENNFIDKIKLILAKYKIDPKYIEFEITESIAINDNTLVAETFNKIKELGFSIAMDDFGTGYSSLSRLQEMPLDRLKIDKSFVDGIEKDEKKEIVIKLIIEYAKLLNLFSIAEGVEEKYQIDHLKNNGCDEIQGYFYAKPMRQEDFEQYIRNHNK